MVELSIRIGARLSGPGGTGTCTIGAFAKGTDDTTLAVTVWHAFAHEKTLDVHLEGSSVRVGSLLPPPGRELTRRPFWTAIGLVRLDDGIKRSDAMHENEYAPLIAAPLDTVLGKQVCRFGVSGSSGIVAATHGILRLTNPLDHRTFVYEDTVEVRFASASGLGKGDAGSLVMTRTGEALGLVVAAGREVCYVAPLAPLLEKETLTLVAASPVADRSAAGDFILAHNRQIRDDLRAEEPFDLGPMPEREAA